MTRLRLEAQSSGEIVARAEPDGDVVRIGRSVHADLRVDDRQVAPLHACLIRDEHSVWLEDSGSGRKTAVRRGQARIEAGEGTGRVALSSGDVIELGGEPGAPPVDVSVLLEDDPEEPRVVELRPLENLPGGASPRALGDATLRTICELQRQIAAADDLAGVTTAVADAALVLVPRATHASVMLRDETTTGDGGFVPVVTRVRGPSGFGAAPAEPVRVARSVFRKVVRERAAVLAADANTGELSSESLLGASIRSTIGVPLWQRDAIVGVLQLDNRAAPGMFQSSDVDAVAVLAASASLAVANSRLIRKLELTEDQLERENRFLKGRERSRRGATEIIGQSRAFLDLLRQIGKVADTRVSVLIEGETGSGKELVAGALHYRSRRKDRLFVAQNCAALPENLLESELFGHKRGAFTGATEDRKGLFELADGGTLFLDEVTEMPLPLQAKLLRVLQEGEVRPVGGNQVKSIDVRIVAATNRSLEGEVSQGRFREDLYYRLKVFPLRVPPLRERREDIPLLVEHLLSRFASELGKPIRGFSAAALSVLVAYEWPGNVRELSNEVQRCVIQTEPDAFVTPELLSPKIRKVENALSDAGLSSARSNLKEMMDQVERHLVLEALEAHGNNKTNAAKALGITREGLHKKLKSLGIE